MAPSKADACSTFSCNRCRIMFVCFFFLPFLLSMVMAGHHGNGKGMEKLLAAGLIAKALAKGGEESGGGGGHHYMPIPIPMHSGGGGGGGGGGSHHHVHHKYVPIPVKHHTNFIIAHHRVPVPVHVPVPVVKTRVVQVPVEQTRIVPIIVHKGHNSHPRYTSFSGRNRFKKLENTQHISASSASGLSAVASATSQRDTGSQQLRITSLGTVRKLKEGARNGTSSIQFKRPSSRSPEKWIVVVKNKRRRPSSRRLQHAARDSMTADTKVIPRTAIANSTAIIMAGPR